MVGERHPSWFGAGEDDGAGDVEVEPGEVVVVVVVVEIMVPG